MLFPFVPDQVGPLPMMEFAFLVAQVQARPFVQLLSLAGLDLVVPLSWVGLFGEGLAILYSVVFPAEQDLEF